MMIMCVYVGMYELITLMNQYVAQENPRRPLTLFAVMSTPLSTQTTILFCVHKELVVSLGLSGTWEGSLNVRTQGCRDTAFSVKKQREAKHGDTYSDQQQEDQNFQAFLSCIASSRRAACAARDPVFKKKERKKGKKDD